MESEQGPPPRGASQPEVRTASTQSTGFEVTSAASGGVAAVSVEPGKPDNMAAPVQQEDQPAQRPGMERELTPEDYVGSGARPKERGSAGSVGKHGAPPSTGSSPESATASHEAHEEAAAARATAGARPPSPHPRRLSQEPEPEPRRRRASHSEQGEREPRGRARTYSGSGDERLRHYSGGTEEDVTDRPHLRNPFKKMVRIMAPHKPGEDGSSSSGGEEEHRDRERSHSIGETVSHILKKVHFPSFVKHHSKDGSFEKHEKQGHDEPPEKHEKHYEKHSSPEKQHHNSSLSRMLHKRRAAEEERPRRYSEGSCEAAAVPALLARRRDLHHSPERRARFHFSPERAGRLACGSSLGASRGAAGLLRGPRDLSPRSVERMTKQMLQPRSRRKSCTDLDPREAREPRHVVVRTVRVPEEELMRLRHDPLHHDPPVEAFTWNTIDQEDESQIYIKFFKFHKCYDLIPTSAKLVVFDTQLLVKKAFFALVYNGVRAAPLWDSKKQQYVGMLTITDFIRILQMYYKNSDERIEELEEHKLETWRTVLESDSKPLIYIGPEASLHAAIVTLLKNRIHRLPVIDPVSGDVLYIITHKRILRFLCLYVSTLPRPSFVNRTLGELRIGTYDTIETARPETPVIEALTKFVNRRVSALPIVDADNKLTHIYAKFDVINLAAEKTYNNLNVPLMAANSHRSNTTVEACRLSDTLAQVMDKIVAAEVHRLVITDDEQHVIGIISLSDILDALVLRPHEYNTGLHDSGSGGDLGGDTELLGEDESHTIVEEEPGDEEEPLAAASAGVGGLSLGKNG